MTLFLLFIIVGAPVLAILLMLAVGGPRFAATANVTASLVVFTAAVPLVARSAYGAATFLHGLLLADPLGAWVVLCTASVYLLASLYAAASMHMPQRPARLVRFYELFAGFALATLVAPLMNNVGLYWIAIEFTTLVSSFLVAFHRDPESIEAAWKYMVVVSAGISLSLLGTVLLYWAGSFALGPSYDMTWGTLQGAAARMSPGLVLLAFLLLLAGYGTKVGLAPMHTWLPDAHSESPAPVSALLSGALLNAAMVGIIRGLAVVEAAGKAPVAQAVLMGLGALSLLVAALFIVRQRGIKRLMAYSSVEHMGIIALGFGFGGPLGVAGALYHMLNHSLNKALMFFGAGSVLHSYNSKNIGSIREVGQRFPLFGALWLAGAVAITGAPPFGLFASELTILRASFAGEAAWLGVCAAVLLIVIFVGFLNHFRVMYFMPAAQTSPPEHAPSLFSMLPMALALAPLLLFGLWWPQALWGYFGVIARSLGVAP